jgi:hypothetical protein
MRSSPEARKWLFLDHPRLMGAVFSACAVVLGSGLRDVIRAVDAGAREVRYSTESAFIVPVCGLLGLVLLLGGPALPKVLYHPDGQFQKTPAAIAVWTLLVVACVGSAVSLEVYLRSHGYR